MPQYAIAIHGGAGDLPHWGLIGEREKEYHKALREIVQKARLVLKKGGSSLDAVETALIGLEDCPLFNAGKGAAFTSRGTHELDASIMCGKTLEAGAAALLRKVKNPIMLARKIMEHSQHLFLAGEAADDLAGQLHLELVDNSYFSTKEKEEELQHEQDPRQTIKKRRPDHGTAGAVALDKQGNLAAGTTTGGLTNKSSGRIGDSPIIGAGTYAKNETCAVSCTGNGESIIRAVAAHEISSLLKYNNLTLHEACEHLMQEKLTPFGGDAGLVAMDAKGNIKYVHNSERFYRAWASDAGQAETAIY